MSRYDWIIRKPIQEDRRRGFREGHRRTRRLTVCASCGLEFSRSRKTCPACLRRERTDAA